MLVTCGECQEKLDKLEAISYKKKNYHPACYEIKIIREELHTLICDIFKFKMPGPRVYKQISDFLERGYSYKGMINALNYFYNVKNNSVEKANNGIGIIPYVYDEAQDYFNRIDYKKEKIAAGAKNINQETKIVILKEKKEEIKEIFDLNSL